MVRTGNANPPADDDLRPLGGPADLDDVGLLTIALARALDRLVSDDALREGLGGAGPERIAAAYGATAMTDAYEALYHEVLSEPAR